VLIGPIPAMDVVYCRVLLYALPSNGCLPRICLRGNVFMEPLPSSGSIYHKMKITAFWKVMPCSLVDRYCSCILNHEAARSTEAFVLIYQTTLRQIPGHKLSPLSVFSVQRDLPDIMPIRHCRDVKNRLQ
jgi:hypothetical protein